MSDASAAAESPTSWPLAVTVIGGPTAVLEWGGLRLILDPTFDAPRLYGSDGDGLEKTAGPAIAAADLPPLDIALVSHHHHEDNLDFAGRELSLSLPLILTTPAGADDLAARGGTARVVGLADHAEVALDDAAQVGAELAGRAPAGARIRALPAQHGPAEWSERLGPVCGFLLTAPGLPSVYVSGDNSEVSVVRAIAEAYGPVDAAVLFAGAARVPSIDAPLTLTAADAREAALILGARRVVGVHVDQWTHFSEGRDALEREFAGLTSSAGGPLLAPTPLGERASLVL